MLQYLKLFTNWWNDIPNEDEKEPHKNEARDQVLNKASKIQTGLEGVILNSFNKLDKAEHEAVNTYRNHIFDKKIGTNKPHDNSGGGDGDDGVTIADDIKTTNITRTGLGVLPALLLGGGLAAGGWLLADALKPVADVVEDTKEVGTGNITLKHLSDFKFEE